MACVVRRGFEARRGGGGGGGGGGGPKEGEVSTSRFLCCSFFLVVLLFSFFFFFSRRQPAPALRSYLVEEDQVVNLLLHLSLGPFLFFFLVGAVG